MKQVDDTIEQKLVAHMVQSVKDYAIFALDTKGNIVTWNLGAEHIKGYTQEEIVGKHFSVFYPEEVRKANHCEYELAEALKHGSYEEEGWRVKKDGSLFWAVVVITALYDDDGKHIGFAKVTRDLTERRKALESSAKSEQMLKAAEDIFNSVVAAVKDYAIFVLSPAGNVRTWNAGAERINGYSAEEIIEKHFSIFYTPEAKEIDHPGFELKQAIQNGSYEEEGWRVRKDGSQFWASVTITPIYNGGGVEGFVKVTRDLTERKENEAALERARDEAVLANKLKSRFVANISHEIRTPLSGIVGLGQLVADDLDVDEVTRDYGHRIYTASKQLLAILNDLLDFAKLEAGKVDVEKIPYVVADVVDQVQGLTKTKAEEKSLSMCVHLDESLPRSLVGDPTKIRQILLNLVHNAIKFTESGGIDISIERQNGNIMFSVTDTGIGVPSAVQDKLFEPFSQGDESTARVFGGTGLGLSIAQQFVELMHGDIGLVSECGKGSTFWFSLPLIEAKAA